MPYIPDYHHILYILLYLHNIFLHNYVVLTYMLCIVFHRLYGTIGSLLVLGGIYDFLGSGQVNIGCSCLRCCRICIFVTGMRRQGGGFRLGLLGMFGGCIAGIGSLGRLFDSFLVFISKNESEHEDKTMAYIIHKYHDNI